MNDIDEKIAKKQYEMKKLKQQKRDKIAKDKKKEQKVIDRCSFKIGHKMIEHFPQKLNLNSTQTKEEQDKMLNDFIEYIIKLDTNENGYVIRAKTRNNTQSMQYKK